METNQHTGTGPHHEGIEQQQHTPPILTEAEAFALLNTEMPHLDQQPTVKSAAACLATILQSNAWVQPQLAHLHGLLKRVLLRAAARYLLLEKRRNRALDPVANFHLQNGAAVLSLNWQSDMSELGLARSFGICVNYVYDTDQQVHENNKMYILDHRINSSDEVIKLLEL